ncbi:MAG: Na/Pi cotransporter family protein [Firmicutes bacterium]|nr:Na/Pi cotransporter family protein [Bacillota bacterium]
MVVFYRIVALLGGLSMFLYGMRVMGDGLKASSGGAMKEALSKVTNNPALSFLLGVLVTCVIQSSTATIVLTVGLVGAGFLTFRQSIGIVLGANVGTAITAQIIRLMDLKSAEDSLLYFFKADNLAPLALVIGIALIMFSKRGSHKNMGSIACGFGVLFMGLIYMSGAVAAFSDKMSGLLVSFENNYFLQVLAGVGVTAVIQSSSAVVGIIQSIASSIGVEFCGIFAVIIGVNIGDCITTYIVCRIGASPEQKRTATVHVLYNIFAATLIIVVLTILRYTGIISDNLWTMPLDSGGVANIHGIFRLVPAVLFLPFSGLFATVAEKLIPEIPKEPEDIEIEKALNELDPLLITSPVLALSQVEHLIGHMSDIAIHNYDACVRQIYEYDAARDGRINQREIILDRVIDRANEYVVSISPYVVRDRDNRNQNFQIKALRCFERIGDLAVNIAKAVDVMRDNNQQLTDYAKTELRLAVDAIYEILDLTQRAYKENSAELARQVEPFEEVIDDLIETLNSRHVYRMMNNICDPVTGIQYQTILQNLEHISDMCSDLAIYILQLSDPEVIGNEHDYIHELHHTGNAEYQDAYKEHYAKYFGALNDLPFTKEGTPKSGPEQLSFT